MIRDSLEVAGVPLGPITQAHPSMSTPFIRSEQTIRQCD